MVKSAIDARLNVTSDGKRFRCDFIREGPVYYPEQKLGIECLRRETIAASLDTFLGKPLVIEHIDPRLNVADPAIFAQYAHGVVDKVGRDHDSGFFYCEGTIDTDEGRQAALMKNPSCGYNVRMTGPGGRWNNVPYERELTQIDFHHLALCSGRSRYEESDFRLNAVINPTGSITMFKFLRHLKPAVAGAAATTEEIEIPADTTIKVGNKDVRLNEAVEAYTAAETAKAEAEKKRLADEAAAAPAAAARENALNNDSDVVVNGKKVKVSDLTAAYQAKQDAAAAAETARLNAEAAGREDFAKLQAAGKQPVIRTDFPQTAGTVAEGMKRGRY